jgi:urease accessory protein
MAGKETRRDAEPALIRVDAVLGHVADKPWRSRLAGARLDVLRLDQAEAQKSRLRKATEGGGPRSAGP